MNGTLGANEKARIAHRDKQAYAAARHNKGCRKETQASLIIMAAQDNDLQMALIELGAEHAARSACRGFEHTVAAVGTYRALQEV